MGSAVRSATGRERRIPLPGKSSKPLWPMSSRTRQKRPTSEAICSTLGETHGHLGTVCRIYSWKSVGHSRLAGLLSAAGLPTIDGAVPHEVGHGTFSPALASVTDSGSGPARARSQTRRRHARAGETRLQVAETRLTSWSTVASHPVNSADVGGNSYGC